MLSARYSHSGRQELVLQGLRVGRVTSGNLFQPIPTNQRRQKLDPNQSDLWNSKRPLQLVTLCVTRVCLGLTCSIPLLSAGSGGFIFARLSDLFFSTLSCLLQSRTGPEKWKLNQHLRLHWATRDSCLVSEKCFSDSRVSNPLKRPWIILGKMASGP